MAKESIRTGARGKGFDFSFGALRSLRAKFLALIIPLVLLSTVIVFGFSEFVARRDANRKLRAKLDELVEIQGAVLSQPLWNVAHSQVRLILGAIAIDPDVLGAIVYDESDQRIATVGETEGLAQQAFFAKKDITYRSGGDQVVVGRLVIALTDVRTREESATRLLVIAGMATLLLLSVVGIAVAAHRRTIGIPLEKLMKSINRVRKRGERVPVDWSSRDEIGEVVTAFNEMQARQQAYETDLRAARDELESRVEERTRELAEKSKALERLSSQLAKYLSPQIYDSIFQGKREVKVASQRKKLTIFFSDVAGFTGTTDRLEPEELTNLVNHYLTEMTRIALDYGATVDKYIGDGVMIFFGDPETRGTKEDALQCVEMAIAMRGRMGGLADEWRQIGIDHPLKVRMGINTGYCTVGNIGSEVHMDYTILGGSVNVASRLESAATPGDILISYETFALVKDDILCEEQGSMEVAGIAHPVPTYRVIDSYGNLGRQHERFGEEHPHFSLDLNLEVMTANEKSEAARLLQRGLTLLKKERAAAKPAPKPRRRTRRGKPVKTG